MCRPVHYGCSHVHPPAVILNVVAVHIVGEGVTAETKSLGLIRIVVGPVATTTIATATVVVAAPIVIAATNIPVPVVVAAATVVVVVFIIPILLPPLLLFVFQL